MSEFRIVQGGKAISKSAGPTAEEDSIRYAMEIRKRGAVTIQRQQRSGGANPDGKWYWKRHMLIEQWPV